MENRGLRTKKSKHNILKDVWGQAGQEGVRRDRVVTRAEDTKADITGTNVGVMGRNERCVAQPRKG